MSVMAINNERCFIIFLLQICELNFRPKLLPAYFFSFVNHLLSELDLFYIASVKAG